MNNSSTNPSMQQLFIETWLSSSEIYALTGHLCEPSFFLPEHQRAVAFIREYFEEYHAVPSPETLNANTANITYGNIPIRSDTVEYITREIEKFARREAVKSVVIKGSKLIAEDNYGSLEEDLRQALTISIQRDLGISAYEDVASRIKKRLDESPRTPTGWPVIDSMLKGGWRRKEMFLISAQSGGGKSIALANLAINKSRLGYNVLYISLELSEDMICDRIETMITGFPEQSKNEDPDLTERVIRQNTEGCGNIYVKYIDSDTSNANKIRAYIQEFELVHKAVPDVLIVDYLDLLGTNSRMRDANVYEKDKTSSTELKSVGVHYNMFMATASQQNRGSIEQMELTQASIAGGLSKVNIVDIYIAIIMTPAQRAVGEAIWCFLKTRSADAVGKTVLMSWDPVQLWFRCISEGVKVPEKITKRMESAIANDNEEEYSSAHTDLLDLLEFTNNPKEKTNGNH